MAGPGDVERLIAENPGCTLVYTARVGRAALPDREEAETFLSKLTLGEKEAVEWARAIPLASSDELTSYH